MILYLDIETKSHIDLAKSGVYAYTEASSFEILLIAYAFDEEEVKVIEVAKGELLPSSVREAILDDKITKYAFNANFERICLSKYLNTYLSPRAFSCTQGLALSLGLPISLASVAKALNLELQKDTEGKSLIKYFNENKPSSHQEKWDKFKNYCKTDCIVERAIRKKLKRTAFISGENKKLIISDFSAIEARLLSYLAREQWRIEVFNTHGKIYEASAAKMFNTDINLITKDSPLRQSCFYFTLR